MTKQFIESRREELQKKIAELEQTKNSFASQANEILSEQLRLAGQLRELEFLAKELEDGEKVEVKKTESN